MSETMSLEAVGLYSRIDRADLQETEYGAYGEIGGVEVEVVDDENETRIHLPVAFENDGEEDWGSATVTVRDGEIEVETP